MQFLLWNMKYEINLSAYPDDSFPLPLLGRIHVGAHGEGRAAASLICGRCGHGPPRGHFPPLLTELGALCGTGAQAPPQPRLKGGRDGHGPALAPPGP